MIGSFGLTAQPIKGVEDCLRDRPEERFYTYVKVLHYLREKNQEANGMNGRLSSTLESLIRFSEGGLSDLIDGEICQANKLLKSIENSLHKDAKNIRSLEEDLKLIDDAFRRLKEKKPEWTFIIVDLIFEEMDQIKVKLEEVKGFWQECMDKALIDDSLDCNTQFDRSE